MNDLILMKKAFLEAAKGDPAKTFENPRVGALIVKDGQIIARGHHENFGQEHAEMVAYRQLADKTLLKNATVYVTLEPCATKGKVESCAREMANWPINRVVIGAKDPNPSTCGKGIQFLTEAGIETTILNFSRKNHELNPAFFHYFESGLPYVTLKLTSSATGFVAEHSQRQSKLSDEEADNEIHHLRAQFSAILVGSQTFLTDLPQLTVRKFLISHHQPVRIVLDRRGRLMDKQHIKQGDWFIYTKNQVFASESSQAILTSGNLLEILQDIGKRGIQSILVEGGPKVIASFLQADLWQEMILYRTTTELTQGLKVAIPKVKGQFLGYFGNSEKIRFSNVRRDDDVYGNN